MASQTEGDKVVRNLPVVRACIKIRDDNGSIEHLGSVREFVEIEGVLYDLAYVTSVPGVLKSQAVVEEDDRNPYLVCEQRRTTNNKL